MEKGRPSLKPLVNVRYMVCALTDEETGWPPDISIARHCGRLYACYLLSRVLHTHMRAFCVFFCFDISLNGWRAESSFQFTCSI